MSRRHFLRLATFTGVSLSLGLDFSPTQTLAMGLNEGGYKGAVVRNGFRVGPGYVAAPFWTPGKVPSMASLDVVWHGASPAEFGFWVDRFDHDGDVITPVMKVGSGMFHREYKQAATSHFGTFPLEPKAEHWAGVAFLSDVMEIQHIQELRVVPLWENE